ncbi:MAG TPA: competence protein CoiA family protein [Fimbriimonadaceae bacterium]|nr:competence protein CoiA family protein [Fimbriimonadaceae bacterium]
MIFALDERGLRVEARRGLKAKCPICGAPVRAKCGEVRVWHWAHEQQIDCDPWGEHESEWHRGWKALAPLERVEVTMGPHRADIVATDGAVIELQYSSISPQEIREREAHYGRMVWLLNGGAFRGKFRVELLASGAQFDWAHARVSWRAARRGVFIHGYEIGRYLQIVDPKSGGLNRIWRAAAWSDDIFQVKSLERRRFAGCGRQIPKSAFIDRLIG